MKKYQQGFSLVEIFISLSVGLVLFAGVLSVFVGMRTTTSETTSMGTLQENARFALSVLTDDLLREGFWGGMSQHLTASSLVNIPGQPANDCEGGGLNNASFPKEQGHFRSIWGMTTTTVNALGCINDAVIGSDVLQIKRVLSRAVIGNTDVNLYYLNTNASAGTLFSGVGAGTPPEVNNGQIWEYQHHVYYINNEIQGDALIPVLRQGRLSANNGMRFQPLIEGIEMIRFMYGVDTDNDGAVNAFISADNMTPAFWDKNNNTNILAVKIYVLARDILPDMKYQNMNTYQLGDLAVDFITDGVGDNYRRLLVTSTVTLYNSRIDTWP